MPLFDYRCPACDRVFELLIRTGVTPTCPTCGSTSIEKQLSVFAVSSDETARRSWKKLNTAQKETAKKTNMERDFYRHDHHDH
jgi:putative FmdB family regulatory protein